MNDCTYGIYNNKDNNNHTFLNKKVTTLFRTCVCELHVSIIKSEEKNLFCFVYLLCDWCTGTRLKN